jgi:hypothetical protein
MTGAINALDPTTSGNPVTLSYFNTHAASAVTVGDAPPASPTPGALWWSSADAQLYLWYSDPDSSQWIIANSSAVTGTGGIGTITGISPGTGLTGGGTSGVVTLALTTPVAIANGGTNATTATTALSNLGGLPLTGGTISGNLTVAGASNLTVTGPGGSNSGVIMVGPSPSTYGNISADTGNIAIRTPTGNGAFYFQNATAANTRMFIAANGGVNIGGTTDPGAGFLQANTIIVAAAGYPKVVWNSTANATDQKKWQSYVQPGGSFRLASLNDAESAEGGGTMFFRSGGVNIGGQTDPGASTLRLENPANNSDTYYWTQCGNRQWLHGITGASLAWILWDNTAGATRIQINTNGSCLCTSGTWGSLSDIRVKREETITAYTRSLADITRLNPVCFRYRDDLVGDMGGQLQYGFVAQQVEPIMPELVGEITLPGDPDKTREPMEGVKTVDPGRAIYAVINALKEINERLVAVEAKLEARG